MNIEYRIATNITFNHVIEKIENLTFPPIRKKIKSMPIHEPYTGVWAMRNNEILGLILAADNKQGIAELFSFFVKPEERNKGIGSQLLSMLETTLQKQGLKYIRALYRSDWKSIEYIEKLLTNNNWESPVLLRTITEGDFSKYSEVVWPTTKFPSDYSMFNWEELTNEDRKEIDILIKAGEVPNELNPFQHEDRIFMPGSLGLRYKNKLIGWNIVYQLNPETLEYNNLYIKDGFRKLGHSITMLHRSFDKQYESKIPKAAWILYANNPSAMKTAVRIAGKYVYKLVEEKISRKLLN